ncbi:MAG TPA: biopolymer transporter ExbD [Rhodocyclaceae bacterium]|nr:biopolymer transporter ExbD [Rhodocyclaceae bacterium]
MNFRRGISRDEPEINLIPLIDVLLVILIFVMVTTTYSKVAGLEINLPSGQAQDAADKPNEIDVMITATGEILVNRTPVAGGDVASLEAALRRAASGAAQAVVVIHSDKDARLQSSIDVMQAAQQAGLSAVSFAIQKPGR